MAAAHPPLSTRMRLLQWFLLTCISLFSYAALVLPLSLRPSTLPLRVGDVAPRTLQAPYDLEYVSQVRTEEARQAAERAVQPVYTPPDPAIARQQIERLRSTLQYISLVRVETLIPPDQKRAELAALSEISLKPESIEQIIAMSDPRWEALQQEALRVLEQVMRSPIRVDTLEVVRESVPSRVSLALSEQNAALVTELVSAFVIPNSQFSADLTAAAQKSAREAVQPIVQRYKAGETIVNGGEIITPAMMEALQQFGLIRSAQPLETYLGTAALTLLFTLLMALYAYRRQRLAFVSHPRSLLTLVLVFIVFLGGARLIIPNRTILPYVYPLAAVGLVLATLFGTEAGMIFSLVLGSLAAYGLPNALELTSYYWLSSLGGVLTLGPARRFWAFFRAGLAIAGAGMAVILAYHVPTQTWDVRGLLELLLAALTCGIASASVALLLQYSLAQFLSLPTPLQLLEISHPDFPLLQLFLRNAPGTYQHSLQVANLAEQAAEKIDADPLLTRVGALFHDIGKAMEAAFFVENQAPGTLDTHTDTSPEEVAARIIRHVQDGVALARKHRLPRRIEDFILEHHGTLLTRYQYNQALQREGGDPTRVDERKFRYPGPCPRSRETAILMLADAVEARARAESPKTEEELHRIVHSVIEYVQKEGQLNNAPLTLRDLSLIADSFAATLRGTYHPRIQYPSAEPPLQKDGT